MYGSFGGDMTLDGERYDTDGAVRPTGELRDTDGGR